MAIFYHPCYMADDLVICPYVKLPPPPPQVSKYFWLLFFWFEAAANCCSLLPDRTYNISSKHHSLVSLFCLAGFLLLLEAEQLAPPPPLRLYGLARYKTGVTGLH